MESSSDQPRSKPRSPSGSASGERRHTGRSPSFDDDGAGASNVYRRASGTPRPISRYGAVSPTGYFSDNPINLNQVNGRAKLLLDKQPKTSVKTILQSSEASMNVGEHFGRGTGLGGAVNIPGVDPSPGGQRGRQSAELRGGERRRTHEHSSQRRRRHRYSPTGSVSSWNKSRSSTGESAFSMESTPVTGPQATGKAVSPPLLPPPPPTAGAGPSGPLPGPPTGMVSYNPILSDDETEVTVTQKRRHVKQKGADLKREASSLIKDMPRLSPAEHFPPPQLGGGAKDQPPTDKYFNSGTSPSTSPTTGTTSARSTATEDTHIHGSGHHSNLNLQAGFGPRDDLDAADHEPQGDAPVRWWSRCRRCCWLYTILIVVLFVVFVSVWATVISLLPSSSLYTIGFCETTKVDFNRITSEKLTVAPKVGDIVNAEISYEPCDVKTEIYSAQVKVTALVNESDVNRPGLTRHVFLMEKENSMVNITVCTQESISNEAILYFYVFKTVEYMHQWEEENHTPSPYYPPSCKVEKHCLCRIPVFIPYTEGCRSFVYNDSAYCDPGVQPFSGHHYFTSLLHDSNGAIDFPIDLNVTLNLTAPRYFPGKLRECSFTTSSTDCHVNFSWFPIEVFSRKNWCVFLNVSTSDCHNGLLEVDLAAHQRYDIVWNIAILVVVTVVVCLVVGCNWCQAIWRHRYFQRYRNYARLP